MFHNLQQYTYKYVLQVMKHYNENVRSVFTLAHSATWWWRLNFTETCRRGVLTIYGHLMWCIC